MSFTTKGFSWLIAVFALLTSGDLLANEPAKPIRKVTVSAKAQVDVEPNEVLLTLWVETKDKKDLLKAKTENDKITRAVLALAAKHEIPDEQFTMTRFEMGPKYERRKYGEKPVFVGYSVNRSIKIAIRDFTKLEPVLSDALEAGVTRIDDLLLRIRRPRKAQARVRRLAVELARDKATQLAELNGLILGPPITINSNISHNEQVWGDLDFIAPAPEVGLVKPNSLRFRLVGQKSELEIDVKKKANTDKLLAPGTITLESTVTITFEMVERVK